MVPIFMWNHTRYFQLTLGQEREKGLRRERQQQIGVLITRQPHQHSHHPHPHPHTQTHARVHTHTHARNLTEGFSHIHGTPCQTEPIILAQAMRSLMSSINSNHRICHDGDGFLCLFALITGQSDSLAKLIFT